MLEQSFSLLRRAALLAITMGVALGCDGGPSAAAPNDGDAAKAETARAATPAAAPSDAPADTPAAEPKLEGACHYKDGKQCLELYMAVKVKGTQMACEGPGDWKTEPCPTKDVIARCEKMGETTFYYPPAEKVKAQAKDGCAAFGGKFIDGPPA